MNVDKMKLLLILNTFQLASSLENYQKMKQKDEKLLEQTEFDARRELKWNYSFW